MLLTRDDLLFIMPGAKARVDIYLGPLNTTMDEFAISDTPQRAAMFLAQIAHESLQLIYTHELASGEAYEGRADLGNTEPGDGVRFKGHGFIQITGRENHTAYAAYKGMSLEDVLEYLHTPDGAANCSGWYWMSRKLSEIADEGDFVKLTRKINGGINGLADRIKYWERAKERLC